MTRPFLTLCTIHASTTINYQIFLRAFINTKNKTTPSMQRKCHPDLLCDFFTSFMLFYQTLSYKCTVNQHLSILQQENWSWKVISPYIAGTCVLAQICRQVLMSFDVPTLIQTSNLQIQLGQVYLSLFTSICVNSIFLPPSLKFCLFRIEH